MSVFSQKIPALEISTQNPQDKFFRQQITSRFCWCLNRISIIVIPAHFLSYPMWTWRSDYSHPLCGELLCVIGKMLLPLLSIFPRVNRSFSNFLDLRTFSPMTRLQKHFQLVLSFLKMHWTALGIALPSRQPFGIFPFFYNYKTVINLSTQTCIQFVMHHNSQQFLCRIAA